MATAAVPLLSAIYNKLTSDPALAGIEVYDYVPETSVTPYITLGEPYEMTADQHDNQGLDVELMLHVWSRYHGYKECAEIVKAIHGALDRQPLTVEGFKNVSVAANGTRYSRDPDPEIRHGVAQFRAWLTVDNVSI